MNIHLTTEDLRSLRIIYQMYEKRQRTSPFTTDAEKTFHNETLRMLFRAHRPYEGNVLHTLPCTPAQWSSMTDATDAYTAGSLEIYGFPIPHLHSVLASYALAAAVEEALTSEPVSETV